MVRKTSKTVPKRSAGRRARARRPSRKQPVAVRDELPAVEATVVAPAPVPGKEVEASSPAGDIALSVPELGFAAGALPPEPERPLPSARRAIFFDVENTSRPDHIARVIDHLAVDRLDRRTDFVAVGNWKVIGHDTARLLARHGVHLVHSAPSVGVRDWSDLRIAVAAGVWLAGARPGDVLEIVTNDRAFDAVGDVAAGLGIGFTRLSHQGLVGGASEVPAPARESAGYSRPRRRAKGRRRGSWRGGTPGGLVAVPGPARHVATTSIEPPEAAAVGSGAGSPPHTAPHEEIIAAVHELMQGAPTRPVTLDTLANTLKARGFSRPPGSPRLVTRLRRIKEIALSRSGVITLVEAAEAAGPVVSETAPAGSVESAGPDSEAAGSAQAPGNAASSRRRRSRRGGRWRRQRRGPAPVA